MEILKEGNILKIGKFENFRIELKLSETEKKRLIKIIENKLDKNEEIESATYQLLISGYVNKIEK